MRKGLLSFLTLCLCLVQADVFRHLNTARIAYFNERDYERAREACLAGLEIKPENYELNAILGGAEMGLGNWQAAALAFEKAFAADTSKTLDWIVGQAEGERYYFQAFYFYARDLFDQAEYSGALHYLSFDDVFGIDDVNVYVLRGASLYKLGMLDQANREYTKVLQIDPENPDINFLIGKSLFDSEEYSRCLPYLEEAVRSYGKQYERTERIVFQNLMEPDTALAMDIVLFMHNNQIEELDRLIINALGFPEGLAVQEANIRQFVKLSDDLGRSHYFRAMAYYNLGDDTLALQNLIQAAHLKPDDTDALYFAGEFNVRLGQYADAIPYLRRLTRLAPDDHYAWFYLGVCYTETGEYAKAVDVYEHKVLALDPGNVDVMNNLAYVYREMGYSEKALFWLIRAEEVGKSP